MAHNDNDGDYAEDRGGNRHEGNYISFPTNGVVYKATRKIFPWEPPGAYETEQRMVVPSVYIEALLAAAPVPDPDGRCAGVSRALAQDYGQGWHVG